MIEINLYLYLGEDCSVDSGGVGALIEILRDVREVLENN